MVIHYHRNFLKAAKRLNEKDFFILRMKLKLFSRDPFHASLRNHKLMGLYEGLRSINIKPDLRALYERLNDDESWFLYLGSHSDLYK